MQSACCQEYMLGRLGPFGLGAESESISWLLVQQGAVLLGMVSLFPAENGVEGSVSPFRSDILSLLKDLQPRHAPSA